MQTSYMADELVYRQYKDSNDREERGWSQQAKMRANRTATTYNQFILKNSYVWSGNVPKDIKSELDLIE